MSKACVKNDSVTPASYAHASLTLPANSGPLSTLMD
jgi:hypothetical protein